MSTKFMDTSGLARRRNRKWPEALKREIAAASYEPSLSVSVVARWYNANANQVFKWRKLYPPGSKDVGAHAPAELVPVVVTAEPPACPSMLGDAATIEIVLTDGCCVRVGAGVDGAALRRVLDVLAQAGWWMPR